jgi:hypothetical protein
LITVTASGAYDSSTKDMGAAAKVSLALAEGISAFVASDFSIPDVGDMSMEFAANVAATFGMTSVGVDGYFLDNGTTQTLDAKFMVSDKGTVPGLTASLGVFGMDLLADPAKDPIWFGLGNALTYKVVLSDTMYITPYQKAIYDFAKTATGLREPLYLSVGTTMNLIANTLFTIDYTMGAYLNKAFPGGTFTKTYAGVDADKGRITVTAKVSF